VLVEGAGLAQARLAIDIDTDGRRALAQVDTAAGPLRAEAVLDERGYLTSAGGPVGVSSARVLDSVIDEPFEPPEIVDASAVAVAGARAPPAEPRELRLRIRDVAGAPPRLPDLAVQHILASASGEWDVDVTPAAAPGGAEAAEVRALTHRVATTLGDDLTVAALAPDEARAAGRGDCTAHAVVLAADLVARGYPARLVTGYLYQDGALRRHRWVLVQVAGSWLAVDPMLDQVPASPAHLALAVHGASLDELAFVDDVAFAGWDRARAERVR
jgi:transglutaminase-like putative cysteine protease